MEGLVVVAFALLVFGVVGTVVPFVPGGLLSLGGVLTYWHAAGYQRPGVLLVVALAGTAALAVFVDYFGGAIGAKTGGASIQHAVLASVVGLVGLVLGGPLGLLVGVVGATYALEARNRGHGEETLRVAVAAGIGVLASAVVQVVLTGTILIAMAAVTVGWL
jgi:hypothetical protein